MSNKYKYLFWDLDGTLTQSEFGIIDSVIYALEKMGIEPGERESLKKFIGPPLYEAFKNFYNMTSEDAEEAVRLYREFYKKEGIYNAPLYDGIKETLATLKEQGVIHMVVTSKPADLAEVVVTHQGIREYFEEIVGPTQKEKHSDKTVLVETALEHAARLQAGTDGAAGAEGSDISADIKGAAVMIGDRHYDIDAAVNCNIDSIGVLFGYGSRAELEEAGSTYIVETAADIVATVSDN